MSENILTFNLPNFLTIGIMALLFGAVVGAAIVGLSKVMGWNLASLGQAE